MRFTRGQRSRLPPLVVPLAVLALLLVGGVAAAVGAGGPLVSAAASATINGNWTISTAVTYANTSLYVNGSITIASGGSLTLRNVVLSLSEPSPLAHGIEVTKGGGLTATGSTFESATPANHLWMRADAGASVSITGGSVLDLGGSAGPVGFLVNAAGTRFSGVTFQNYYEALVVSATGVTVDNCSFGSTTSTVSTTYVVSTSGSSSGFVMTHSRIVDTAMVGGGLFVASSSDIENNTFTLNPAGANPTPVLIGYQGSNGFVNASGTKFVYNTVSGSDVTDFDSSHVNISHNKILNTGGQQYVHDYGVRAQVFDPSGTGIWINGLTITYNLISNSTSFGIRIQNNITNAVVAHNNITNISTNPQAGSYNGAQTYEGIYLIRGVTHSLVYANRIDNSRDQENPNINTAGIGLESKVSYCTVANNTILNTDLGIWVQGDWNDGPGQIGPSLHNAVTGNLIRNTLPIVQTHDLASAIQNYDWANYTTISNNTIEGWQMVPSGVSSYEGEAIHQADVFGTIAGNVINGAKLGIVFGYFYGSGVGNGSYNQVYGNYINVTGATIVDDTTSNPGPIVNVVDSLNPHQSSKGFPVAYAQSVGAVSGVAFSESLGTYSTTLETLSPVTGAVENYTTSIAWNAPHYAVAVGGPLGSGMITGGVTFVNASQVTYTIRALGSLSHTVSLEPTTQSYSANYTVRVVGSTSQTFSLHSTNGPAVFSTTATGNLTVTVTLVSWSPTSSSGSVELQLKVVTSGGTPVSNLYARVLVQEPSQATAITLGPTNGSGEAAEYGLPSGTSVQNVSILGSNYTVGRYTVNTSRAGLIQLDVTVVSRSTGGNGTLDLQLSVATANGSAVAGVDVQVALEEPSQNLSVTLGPTNGSGAASYPGLPAGTTVSNVTVLGANYTIRAYSENTSRPGVLRLDVVVGPVTPGGNTSERFAIRFTEHGLPSGEAWQVAVTGAEDLNMTSVTTNITLFLTNGSYEYSATALGGSGDGPVNGTFAIPSDAYVAIAINFPLSSPPGSSPGAPPAGPGSSGPAISLEELVGLYLAAVALGGALVVVSTRLWRERKERRGSGSRGSGGVGRNGPRR